MCGKPGADPKSWIEDVILNFIERSAENTLQGPFQEKAFENPLVGFANGADPIFESYKQYVAAYHWTPLEIFSQTFPGSSVKAEELDFAADGGDQSRQPQAIDLSSGTVGQSPHFRRGSQCQTAPAGGRCVAKGRLCGRRPHAFPFMEAQKIGSVHFCIHLVGTPHGLCRGSWNFRPLRWIDYGPGQSHADGFGSGPH